MATRPFKSTFAPSRDIPSNNHALVALVLFCIAYSIRLAFVSYLSVQPESDYLVYHVMAKNLLAGNGLVDIFGNLAYYNPGYPLVVLAPTYFLFGDDPEVAQKVNSALGGVTAVLVFVVALRLIGKQKWAIVAGLLYTTSVEAIVYCEYLAKENISVPLMLGSLVLATTKQSGKRSLCSLFMAGVLAGVATLVGTSSIYIVPGLIFLGWSGRLSGCRVISVALIAGGLLLALSPWLARNYFVLGAPIVSSSGGFNLYIGNNSNATGNFISIGDTPMASTWHELRGEGEIAADKMMRDAAIDYIVMNPSTTISMALRKILLLWLPPMHHLDPGGYSRAEYVLRIVWFIQYLIIVLGAMILGINRDVMKSPGIGALWLTVFGFTLVHATIYVITRYRVPIMPIMIVLACYGAHRVLSRQNEVAQNSSVSVTRLDSA